MNTIDYTAVALALIGRSPNAGLLIAYQTAGRKTGLRKTTSLTLVYKSRKHLLHEITLKKAEAYLQLYSELGLGSVFRIHGRMAIRWNSRINLFKLGEACFKIRQQIRRAKTLDSINKGKTVVCMLPSGSFEALKATGLAGTLEIEFLAPKEKP